MEEQILKLVYDYSMANKFADVNFIKKVIYIIIEYQDLSKYFNDLRVIDRVISEDDYMIELASYNPVNKFINIYAEGMHRLLVENDFFTNNLHGSENIFYKNLRITQIVLHELEHVEQLKHINETRDIESDILRVSMKSDIILSDNGKLSRNLFYQGIEVDKIIKYIQNSKAKYRQKYEYSPEERLAEIKSYQKIINIIKHLEHNIPKVNMIEEYQYLSKLLKGYNEEGKILSPTINYFNYGGYSSELYYFSWYDIDYIKCLFKSKNQYGLFDRLEYGLPIDKNEYEHIKEEMQYKLSSIMH